MLVQMRSSGHTPRAIVDIKTLAETNRLEVSADGIYIGAAVPSAVINEHPLLQTALPGLLEAADLIGSTQIQGRATICGNLCNASPAGDSIPAMIAAGASATSQRQRYSGSGSRRLCRRGRPKRLGPGEFLLGLKLACRMPKLRMPTCVLPAHRNGHRCGRRWRFTHRGRWSVHQCPGCDWRRCANGNAGAGGRTSPCGHGLKR